MTQNVKCLICLSPYEAKCTASPQAGNQAWFRCDVKGAPC